MKKILSISILAITALIGCGGGGGGSSAPVPQQYADGIWVGSTTSSNGSITPAIGLILDTGEYFFATRSDYSGVSFGNATVSGNTISSSNFKDYYPSLSAFVSGTINGTVTTQSSINVNVVEYYNGTTYTGTGAFTFNSQYNEISSLATIAGNYVSPNAFLNQYSYSVDANGNLTGQTTKCSFTGQVTIRNTSKNMYNLSLSTSNRGGNVCEAGTRILNGVATYVVLPGRTQRALALVGIPPNL